MSGMVMAWLIGEGILTWRWIRNGAPPTPGAIMLSSGMFAALSVLAGYQPARGAAVAMAFGIDLAIAMKLLENPPAKTATGWPPALIDDPTVILPGGTPGQTSLTAYQVSTPSPSSNGTGAAAPQVLA